MGADAAAMVNRKSQLSLAEGKWRGRQAYTLSNGSIRLVTLTGGGHIAELSLADPDSVSPLWVPPWPTMDPTSYRAPRDVARYGTITEGKLLSGIAGHSICLDYFGSPSAEEAEQGLSQHGEAPNSRWMPASRRAKDSDATLILETRLPVARLLFEREMRLCAGEPVVYFRETVANLAKADHFFHWTQHVTLGPPFLAPDEVVVSLPGTKGMTFPHGYDEGKALLQDGKAFEWPKAPRNPKGTTDLTRPLSQQGLGYVVGVLVDPQVEWGFVAALNKQLGLLLAYCFRRVDFPWVALWEENKAIEAVPWRSETVALGLEFSTTPLPVSRRENFTMGGPLFGVPTVTYVAPRQEKTVEYLAVLTKVPADFGRVRSIVPRGAELIVTGDAESGPIHIPASGVKS
jgi:hypothetical protein